MPKVIFRYTTSLNIYKLELLGYTLCMNLLKPYLYKNKIYATNTCIAVSKDSTTGKYKNKLIYL